MGNIQDIYWE